MYFGQAGRLPNDVETYDAGYIAADLLYSLRRNRRGFCGRGASTVADEDTLLFEQELLVGVDMMKMMYSGTLNSDPRPVIISERLERLVAPPQSAVAKCGAALGARLMSSSIFRGCLTCVIRQTVRCASSPINEAAKAFIRLQRHTAHARTHAHTLVRRSNRRAPTMKATVEQAMVRNKSLSLLALRTSSTT